MNPDSATNFVVPDVVASHFHLKEGDVVADFGAGSGYFLKALASKVGPSGRVYACEIQKVLVEKISRTIIDQGLTTVHPLWCDLEELSGTKLQTGQLDAAILINTLFQIEDKVTAAKELARTLRTGGTLLVVDWSDNAAGLGPSPAHITTQVDAVHLFEAEGFVLERDYPAGAHHYGLAFRKL